MATPAKDILALYSSKCKQCGHLDPAEPKKYSTCHFSKGNTECPASEVQFAIVGKAKGLALRLVKARANRDATTEAKILTEVAGQSAAFKARFYSVLDSLGREDHAKSNAKASPG